jgi:hypothetical protein
MEKKHAAKLEMLKMLSKMMSDDGHEELGKGLEGKKLQKVTVAAPSSKGLAEGLSKAQQILKAKLGDKSMESESEDYSEEAPCEECEGKGCPMCEEESGEESEDMEQE